MVADTTITTATHDRETLFSQAHHDLSDKQCDPTPPPPFPPPGIHTLRFLGRPRHESPMHAHDGKHREATKQASTRLPGKNAEASAAPQTLLRPNDNDLIQAYPIQSAPISPHPPIKSNQTQRSNPHIPPSDPSPRCNLPEPTTHEIFAARNGCCAGSRWERRASSSWLNGNTGTPKTLPRSGSHRSMIPPPNWGPPPRCA